jgi:hypothetical protein
MAHRFLLAGMMAMTLAGCASPTHLHVHSGPMAETNPGLIIPYRSTGQGDIGSIKFSYPENAACDGQWERVTHKVAKGLMRDSGDVTWHGGVTGMGEGNTVLHGNSKAQIVGAGDCSDGTSFVFFSVSNGYKSRGGLKDSHGNMFVMKRR